MKTRALMFLSVALIASTALLQAADITPQGNAVLVPAGEYRVGDRSVTVSQTIALPVAPAPIIATRFPVRSML